MSKQSQKSLSRLTIKLFARHAFAYKRYAVTLLVSVPITVVGMNFIEPYIQAEVLQKISQGAFDPNDLWGSFSKEIISFAIIVVMTGIVGWRFNIWLIWNLEMRVQRNLA